MKYINKFIRIITIAPVMAALLLLALYFLTPQYGITLSQLLLSLLFLTVLPVLAYPLQPLFPRYKAKGRKGQRELAIIFSLIGYLCGLIYTIILHPNHMLAIIYLTYLLSGVAIALFTAFTPVKASGHACCIVGPMVVILWYVGLIGLILVAVYVLAFISSLQMKRHTVNEFLAGSVIPVIALLLSQWIVALFAI